MANSFSLPTFIEKISFLTTPYLTHIELHGSHGFANRSYNKDSKLVPLLAFNGPENLLNKFIDPSLPYNDTSRAGKAFFSGTYIIDSIIARFFQTFEHGIFFASRLGVSNTILKSIKAHPISSSGHSLDQNDLDNNQELKAYLEILDDTILHARPRIQDTVINVSTFTIGWAKNFQSFNHADFINIAIQTGIRIPGFLLDNPSHCNKNISSFDPLYSNQTNLGLPIQFDAEFGLLNWLNIGLQTGTVIFIPNDRIVKLNSAPSHNIILSNDYTLSTVKEYPMIFNHFYLEAEELLPLFSCLIGLSYVQKFKTIYESCDHQKYLYDLINKYSTQPSWSRTNIHFQAQLDCSKFDNKYNIILAFLYTKPVTGTSVFQLSRTGGSLALSVKGHF